MPTFTHIKFETVDHRASIVLNRPEKRNALNSTMIGEVRSALDTAASDKDARLILIRGAGKDFCAGADLAHLEEVSNRSVLDNLDDAREFASLLNQIRTISKCVIAVVQGRAFAGGAGLASACDLVIAARSAQFCYPEVRIGFVPAMVLAVVRRNLGEKRAFEILASAKVLSAEEAERIGLINRVTNDSDLESEIDRIANEITNVSASAVMLTKSLLYHIDGMTFEQAVDAGVAINAIARATPDCQEGIRKFLGKS